MGKEASLDSMYIRLVEYQFVVATTTAMPKKYNKMDKKMASGMLLKIDIPKCEAACGCRECKKKILLFAFAYGI
nr:hypothetical protein [Tanacetum cinerariifolium]